ncbi:MAG TPA: CpaD family pilus assembly protein [Vitreimonas sp.]|uniref:CpaD family pilus assembly protein n=1 Tax=Vitreimonas sp. TaxID=3069702 RepID=UPI002D6233CA|nr:CpaD family pilus assembly protein [Vitreimonas sp.]HYD86604.1 CpaD family pilus assembly protein [Vitreimonas sp.]
MKSRLPVLLLGVSTLAACASVPTPEGPPVASAADRHRIEVTQTAERVEILVESGDVSLSPEARAHLRMLASNYLRYGHGPLVLSSPSGGANTDAASVLAHEARMSLVDAGVSYAAVAGSTYDGSGGDAPIVASFTRFEAHAPECAPLWEQDLAHQSNNQPWASFGCATQANLAALVEDPADLLRPRNADPRDSGRRETVMDAYRNGDPTHAERSSDERVAISNAVSN